MRYVCHREEALKLFCFKCGQNWQADPFLWRCSCGSPLLWQPRDDLTKDRIVGDDWSLWRYRPFLSLPNGARPVSLGEGATPLIQTPDGKSFLKLDFLNPTGSFKDRGASVLVSVLKAVRVQQVAEDSSGNAGVALSAYCRLAGIHCHIFVPRYASPGKLYALQQFGALLHLTENRDAAAAQVLNSVQSGSVYASHTYHPYYLQGTKTVAFEIAEQLNWKIGKHHSLFIPVGNGDLLLGIHLGFTELFLSRIIKSLPRLHCVQAEACAPICNAVYGWGVPLTETVAEGVAVPQPPRLHQIIDAVKGTGGDFIAVPETSILNAQDELTQLGLWVEPTGAIAYAGWDLAGRPIGTIVLVTGAGWKSLSPYRREKTFFQQQG